MKPSATPPESDHGGSGSGASDLGRIDWSRLPERNIPTARRLRDQLPSMTAPHSPAAEQFDFLRTRMLGAIEEKGWNRVGITQPRSRSAAAYAAANLAISLARRPSLRVILADLDLRTPRLAAMLGLSHAVDLGQALRDGAGLGPALVRFGPNLALLGNSVPDKRAAETLQEPEASRSMRLLVEELAPDVVLLLRPPVLDSDAGLSGQLMVETLLMIVDGTSTRPADLRSCDRLLADGPPVLGVVLVNAER